MNGRESRALRSPQEARRTCSLGGFVRTNKGERVAIRKPHLVVPSLVIGECRKSDVIAHFTRRDEAEIVINPDDVKITDSVRVGKDGHQRSLSRAWIGR